MTADNSTVDIPTPIYQEVKAWIAQQEAFEAEHQTAAPLTNAQRKALEALRLPVLSTPTIGDVNYVGMLLEYRQKRPGGGEIHWVEEASGVLAGGTTGRVCRVVIAESLAHETGHIDSFPAEGYGLAEATGTPPVFSTKKAAKHFAAKCAVDWLVARNLAPPYSKGAAAAPPQTQVVVPPAADATALKRPTQGTNNTISPPPKRQTTSTTTTTTTSVDGATVGTGRPATELVVALCRDLNITAPRYVCNASALGANMFDGYPDFDDYGDAELIGLRKGGGVEGVAGLEKTRQAVAAKLVVLLQVIKAERDAQLKLLTDKLDADDL